MNELRPAVAAIAERPSCDVLVIGGGINGLAIFRDLALQGVDVVLAERADYCSGASAASSHMIHGGIRYLENGEFRLVRESVVERNRLLRIAPHYVRPLETTVPIFDLLGGILSAPLRLLTHRPGRSRRRGALLIAVGLTIYDTFSRSSGRIPRHRMRRRRAALADLPLLNPEVRYTATYFDAAVENPERLALDVLADAHAAGGDRARSANYVEAVGSTPDGIMLRDAESGREFAVAAPVVVNVSGAWADRTNAVLGRPTHHMGGTKGSHIVVDNAELLAACRGRELFFENSDGRIVLIYPLAGRVLIGTTDIDSTEIDDPVCTDEEIAYFFDLVRVVFPAIELGREHIVYTFSGVRPLPHHDDVAPGFVSRDYRIVREERDAGDSRAPVVFSVVGGKWTTFRALSEHVAHVVLDQLGRPRTVDTRELPIGGGAGFPQDDDGIRALAARRGRGDPERAEQLLRRYGTVFESLLDHLRRTGDDRLAAQPDYSRQEIEWVVARERVVHLGDLVFRRSNLAFRGDTSDAVLEELADIVGTVRAWDAGTRRAEIAAVRARLASHARVA